MSKRISLKLTKLRILYIYSYIVYKQMYINVKIQTSHNTKLLRFDTLSPAKWLQQMMQIHLSQGVLNLTVS